MKYCRPKKDIEFNHDCLGNGMWFFQTVRYEYCEVSTCKNIMVKNGGGYLYFSVEEFSEYFEEINSPAFKIKLVDFADSNPTDLTS